MKRKFYQEVTCPECEGTGLQKVYCDNDEDFMYAQEYYNWSGDIEYQDPENWKCQRCEGRGYILANDREVIQGEVLVVHEDCY